MTTMTMVPVVVLVLPVVVLPVVVVLLVLLLLRLRPSPPPSPHAFPLRSTPLLQQMQGPLLAVHPPTQAVLLLQALPQ
jgi:hypothetical protein